MTQPEQQQPESAPTAQHAPGPWTYKRIVASDENRIVYCLIGPPAELARGLGVAWAGTYGKTHKLATTGIRKSDAECEATARLIAAAPDLRDALILAEGEIHNPGSARAIGKDIVEIIDAALRAAGVPL